MASDKACTTPAGSGLGWAGHKTRVCSRYRGLETLTATLTSMMILPRGVPSAVTSKKTLVVAIISDLSGEEL